MPIVIILSASSPDDRHEEVLGCRRPFEVVVEQMVDDACGEVEPDNEQRAGEETIEREEVEGAARTARIRRRGPPANSRLRRSAGAV